METNEGATAGRGGRELLMPVDASARALLGGGGWGSGVRGLLDCGWMVGGEERLEVDDSPADLTLDHLVLWVCAGTVQ